MRPRRVKPGSSEATRRRRPSRQDERHSAAAANSVAWFGENHSTSKLQSLKNLNVKPASKEDYPDSVKLKIHHGTNRPATILVATGKGEKISTPKLGSVDLVKKCKTPPTIRIQGGIWINGKGEYGTSLVASELLVIKGRRARLGIVFGAGRVRHGRRGGDLLE